MVIDTACFQTREMVINYDVGELRTADGAHPSSGVSSGLFCFRATPGTDILDEYEALRPMVRDRVCAIMFSTKTRRVNGFRKLYSVMHFAVMEI